MSTIVTGNVFKLKDETHLYIAVGETYIKIPSHKDGGVTIMQWVDFSHERCSGSFTLKTEYNKEDCQCTLEYRDGSSDPDCEICNGSGIVMVERKGMDQAILVGVSVKDYIMDVLTKPFDW